jgi:hypothetical protein
MYSAYDPTSMTPSIKKPLTPRRAPRQLPDRPLTPRHTATAPTAAATTTPRGHTISRDADFHGKLAQHNTFARSHTTTSNLSLSSAGGPTPSASSSSQHSDVVQQLRSVKLLCGRQVSEMRHLQVALRDRDVAIESLEAELVKERRALRSRDAAVKAMAKQLDVLVKECAELREASQHCGRTMVRLPEAEAGDERDEMMTAFPHPLEPPALSPTGNSLPWVSGVALVGFVVALLRVKAL